MILTISNEKIRIVQPQWRCFTSQWAIQLLFPFQMKKLNFSIFQFSIGINKGLVWKTASTIKRAKKELINE